MNCSHNFVAKLKKKRGMTASQTIAYSAGFNGNIQISSIYIEYDFVLEFVVILLTGHFRCCNASRRVIGFLIIIKFKIYKKIQKVLLYPQTVQKLRDKPVEIFSSLNIFSLNNNNF